MRIRLLQASSVLLTFLACFYLFFHAFTSDNVKVRLIVPPDFRKGALVPVRSFVLPRGFKISVFANGKGEARMMAFDNSNNLYVTDKANGTLKMYLDPDKDGVAEKAITVDENLDFPNGLAFYKGDLYMAEQSQLVAYRKIDSEGKYKRKDIVIPDLPKLDPEKDDKFVWHATRTIEIGPDSKIYISAGSSCDFCEEPYPDRAAIMRYDLNGKHKQKFASGLRNTVGFIFQKTDSGYLMWGADNGADDQGEAKPPDELNLLVKGGNYGWPYCYGMNNTRLEFPEKQEFCLHEAIPPVLEIEEHSAPIGMAVMPEQGENQSVNFPDEYKSKLFIALQGSNKQNIPSGNYHGYKIVTYDPDTGNLSDFVSGWHNPAAKVFWDRLVGLEFDREGALYVTTKGNGDIYRISYAN